MNAIASMEDPAVAAKGRALRQALLLAALFAFLKFALHLGANLWEAHIGWGYFRDEMYYILCGQHLDWGYVDHGPIVALQARAAVALFGKSLAGIRMFSALAGAATVFLTGVIAWALGGRGVAQALAMLGILLAPEFLGLDSFLSMNSFEAVFWMTAVLAILMLLRGARRVFLNALVDHLRPRRRPGHREQTFDGRLSGRAADWSAASRRNAASSSPAARLIGVALIVLLALPNLLWQIHNHFPTLEFIHNGKVDHKNVVLSPLQFVGAQMMMLSPFSVVSMAPGSDLAAGQPPQPGVAFPRLDLCRLPRAHVRHARCEGLLPRRHLSRNLRRGRRLLAGAPEAPQHRSGSFRPTQRFSSSPGFSSCPCRCRS